LEIIDLSVPIKNGMRVPGENNDDYTDPEVSITPWVTLETKDFAVTRIQMGTHTGTHCDVSSHVIDGGRTLLDFPIETWVGWAAVMDFKNVGEICASDVEKYAHLVKHDTILVIRKSPTDFMSDDARDRIISLKPKSIVFGKGINQKGIEDTLAYLGADIPMIMQADYEMLDFVEQNDLILAVPLKIEGVEAAPMRLMALRGLHSIRD